jgi:hypothetical protein
MSKGQHGNKEAKKPKKVPVAPPPVGEAVPTIAPRTPQRDGRPQR